MRICRIRYKKRYAFHDVVDSPLLGLSSSKSDKGISISFTAENNDSESFQVTLTQSEFLAVQSQYTNSLTKFCGKATS